MGVFADNLHLMPVLDCIPLNGSPSPVDSFDYFLRQWSFLEVVQVLLEMLYRAGSNDHAIPMLSLHGGMMRDPSQGDFSHCQIGLLGGLSNYLQSLKIVISPVSLAVLLALVCVGVEASSASFLIAILVPATGVCEYISETSVECDDMQYLREKPTAKRVD